MAAIILAVQDLPSSPTFAGEDGAEHQAQMTLTVSEPLLSLVTGSV